MTSFEAFLIRWPRESRRLSIPSVDQSTKPSVRRRPSCPCVTGLRSRSRARDRWSDVGPPRVLPEPGMSRLPPPPPRSPPSTACETTSHCARVLCEPLPLQSLFCALKGPWHLAHSSASFSVKRESERPPRMSPRWEVVFAPTSSWHAWRTASTRPG